MITPTDENNVNITWEPPENENGVLQYYQVKIFNELHNFNKNHTLCPNETQFVNFDELGRKDNN